MDKKEIVIQEALGLFKIKPSSIANFMTVTFRDHFKSGGVSDRGRQAIQELAIQMRASVGTHLISINGVRLRRVGNNITLKAGEEKFLITVQRVV